MRVQQVTEKQDGMLRAFRKAGAEWLANLERQNCHNGRCGRWLTVGSLKTRRVGVWMSGAWYCSWACLHDVAQQSFHDAMRAAPWRPPSKIPQTLGLELMSNSVISADQFRELNELQQAEGGEFGDLAVRQGFATEEQVAAARASMWGCPMYQPLPGSLPTGIPIPSLLADESMAVALHFVPATRQLLMGFLHRVDYELMYAAETINDCKIRACFLKASDFEHYRSANSADTLAGPAPIPTTLVEDTQSPKERASILCKYGAEWQADRVKMTRCKNYVWARFEGASSVRDLLLRLN
jgi:hypothetical protein